MKKICSILLAVIMIAASFVTVSSAVPAVAQDDIKISADMFKYTVTVKTADSGSMTAMVMNEQGNNINERLLGAASSDEPEEIVDANGETVGYKYVFDFSISETSPTGTYTLKIGFKGEKVSKEFNFVSLDDRINFYNTLDTKAPEDIAGYFSANPHLVTVDVNVYNSITDQTVSDKVNAEIASLTLATGVADSDTTEQKLEKLAVVDALFTTKFSEFMKVAQIITVTNTGWETLANQLLEEDFDGYFYDTATADIAALKVSDVYSVFKSESAAITELSLDEYSDAFDRATLMLIEKTSSTGMLKNAFCYFEDKGSIVADMTNIDKLIADDKDSKLWKELMEGEYANCAGLVAEAERIAKEIKEDPEYGVIGGITDDKPVNNGGGSLGGGGGSAGGSSSGVVKPEDPTTVVPVGTFTDIASVDWAKEAIEALAEKGVINGKGDGKFAPNDSVTREEFVKIIIGAFDLLNENAKADFGDVDASRWSYAFVATANELGIVTGDGASFNPTGEMSRQDMAVVIYRTAEKLGLELSGDAEDFEDTSDISDYAKDAVTALTASGIVNGMGDGTFSPKTTVTRAQAAKVIYGLMNLVGGGK